MSRPKSTGAKNTGGQYRAQQAVKKSVKMAQDELKRLREGQAADRAVLRERRLEKQRRQGENALKSGTYQTVRGLSAAPPLPQIDRQSHGTPPLPLTIYPHLVCIISDIGSYKAEAYEQEAATQHQEDSRECGWCY